MSSITPNYIRAGSIASASEVTSAAGPATKKRKVVEKCPTIGLPSELYREVVHFLDHNSYMRLALCSKSILEELGEICKERVRACVPRSTIRFIFSNNFPRHETVSQAAYQIIGLVGENEAVTPKEHCENFMHLIRNYKTVLGAAYHDIFWGLTPRKIKHISDTTRLDYLIKTLSPEIREASLREVSKLNDPRQVCSDYKESFEYFKIFPGEFEFLRENFGSNLADLLEGVNPETIITFHQKIRDAFFKDLSEVFYASVDEYLIDTLNFFHEFDRIFIKTVNRLAISNSKKNDLLKRRILTNVSNCNDFPDVIGSIAFYAVSFADKNTDLMILEWVRENLPEVLSVTNKHGWNIAHAAAINECIHVFDWIQQHAPQLLNATDKNGSNIAHKAAQRGHTHVLDWIRQHAAELLSATDKNGWNIAYIAAQKGHTRVLDWIQQHAPKLLSATDKKGWNIAHATALNGHTHVLDWIKKNLSNAIASKLLNAENNGSQNIAHRAAENGHTKVLGWIRQHAPKLLCSTDKQGWNIAHIAAIYGHPHVLDWLRQHAPQPLSTTDKNGWNIAHAAAQKGHSQVLEWIRQHAPEILGATDKQGWNIAHIAAQKGHTHVFYWIKNNLPSAIASKLVNAEKNNGLNIAQIADQNGHSHTSKWIKENLPIDARLLGRATNNSKTT